MNTIDATPAHARFLDDIQAAKILGLSRSYLRQMRVKGGGPKFVRLGQRAIRYQVSELLDWAGERLVTSTSELRK